MFNALRQGSSIFVMDKGNLSLKVGVVDSVTQPTGYNSMPWLQNMPGQTIDVSVKFDDGTSNEFKQMQPNAATAVYGNVIVTETRELMAQEVENMARQSKAVLDTVDYHQKVLKECDGMLAKLSPSFAKEKETDARLNALEQSISQLNGGIINITDMLSKMQGTASASKSTTKNQ